MNRVNWITVDVAAKAINRSKRTIYNWIDRGHLRTRQDEYNRTVIDGQQLYDVEPTIRRGRPVGSSRPPISPYRRNTPTQ